MVPEILSLKSIYRLLRVRDYPIPSDGVLRQDAGKGLTLLSFWKQVLCDRWLQTPHGRIIWRSEGSINRYHSELCNRKSQFPFYDDYAREILDGLSDTEICYQAMLFARFLRDRNYCHPILLRKLSALFDLLPEKDHQALRMNRLSSLLEDALVPDVPTDFLDGWLLTVLTLFALSNGKINGSAFIACGLSVSPVNLYRSIRSEAPVAVEILTNQSEELRHSPLAAESFFGREHELFDLQETAKAGKKMLICGMGGVGKTELVRQLVSRAMKTGIFRRIAFVPYNGSLRRSFSRSFLRLSGITQEECYHESMYFLSLDPNTLLIIDNVTDPEDADLRELNDLPGPVLITARAQSLPGFLSFPLNNPDRQAAELIFRNNYLHSLSPEDLPAFDRMLSQETLHHPLTVSLLARAARANRWSLADLEKRIGQGYSEIRFREDSQRIVLSDMYRQLYESSRIEPDRCRLLRLLALLPCREYTPEELSAMGRAGKVSEIAADLRWLESRGWLSFSEVSDQIRCVMHPLIGKCVLTPPPTEEEFLSFWQYADTALAYDLRNLPPAEGVEEKKRLSESVMHAALLLRKPLSRGLAETCVRAALWLEEDLAAAHQLKAIVSSVPGENRDLVLKTDERFMGFGILSDQDMLSRAEEELARPILPPVWHHRLAVRFIGYLTTIYDNQRALSLLEQEKKMPELTPYEKQEMLLLEHVCQSNLHAYNDACLSAIQGKAIADRLEAGQERKPMTLMWAVYLATILVRTGQQDELAEVQREIRDLRKTTPDHLNAKVQSEVLSAQIADENGRLEDALVIWRNLQELFVRYSGKKSGLYALACVQQGFLCARLGRQKEALEFDDEGLRVCRAYPENESLLHLLLNNKAALLLDMNKPDEALPLLREAVMLTLPQGGIPLAEPQKNLARCMLMKGESSQARQLYEDVLPVFKKNYGENHPKTQEVSRQLRELKKASKTGV